jgi:hypothetical protein
VTCDEARLQIGAEPGASTPGLEEHLQACAACRQFRDEMRALDANIRRAMEEPPELALPRPAAPSPAWRRPPAWRQWALAASVALATFAVLAVWLLRPSDTLARAVVAHVEAEPESWLAQQHVSTADIDAALRRSGVQLDITSGTITYAQSCWFRGHYVPHLVMQTASGPTTILLLRHEPVAARRTFHEDGMSGVLVPSGEGSIAVLARGSAGVEQVAQAMQQDVHWLSDPR